MSLDGYFERIGIGATARPTLDTLFRVHVAHLGAFPFHNVTIQRGGAIELDLDSILGRFLQAGGGGYCFEQNTLLAAALRELGFVVTPLLGRVGPTDRRMLNHMLLEVDVDGQPWIADAGFGGETLLEPIPLRDGVRVSQHGVDFSLRRDGHHWRLAVHCGSSTDELYEFSGAPHTIGDIEMANYYTATHPASMFRQTITIQRVTPEERLILRPRVVTRYRNGERTDEPSDPAMVRRHARELFGIDLGEAPLLCELKSKSP